MEIWIHAIADLNKLIHKFRQLLGNEIEPFYSISIHKLPVQVA